MGRLAQMGIKRSVTLSFIAITILTILIATINLVSLYKIKENQISQQDIYKLVSMQESMNTLLQDLVDTTDKTSLETIKKDFNTYEESFEAIREKLTIDDKDDFLDLFIGDIHHDRVVTQLMNTLFSHEKEIEDFFEEIYNLQLERIDLVKRFQERYPQESRLRNTIEERVYAKNSKELLKIFSNIKYYSKEALFQHRNKEYVDKWVAFAKELHNYSISNIDAYIQIASELGGYVLQIETIKTQESTLQANTNEILKENREISKQQESRIEKLVEEFISKTNLLIGTTLLVTISFITLLSLKVSRNVGLSFNEIEHKVLEKTEEITLLNAEIEETQKEVVFTMGAIGESRSKETGNHVKRVAEYSYLLAKLYGLSEREAEVLKQASPMHDIGKVAIPDAVLNKPGRFNQEERAIMDTHAKLGFDMLKHSNRELLKTAAIVAYEHHERWDKKGYPRKLAQNDIHIYGRITAIADVFDALGSDRVYKKAWSDVKIFALFKEERGKQFDPELIDLFFKNLDEFLKVREKFADLKIDKG